MSDTRDLNLGKALIKNNIIDEKQLNQAYEYIKKQNEAGRWTTLSQALLESAFVKETDILKILGAQYNIPFIDLVETDISKDTLKLISGRLAKEHNIIPVKRDGNQLILAMSDPFNYIALDDAKRFSGLNIHQVLAGSTDILEAIEKFYAGESTQKYSAALKEEYQNLSVNELPGISEGDISGAPVVLLVDSTIKQAFKTHASDIHIEPMETDMRVRFRIDGQLQEVMRQSLSASAAIVTRIKIMAGMDIAEKRLPQDGRIAMDIDGQSVDMRISTLPTVYGEKVEIRLLGLGKDAEYTRKSLGFIRENNALFDRLLKSPHGIILVSGPTGSGKTTTLYTALLELNKVSRNIITVEDPVEYKLEGINQVHVNQKAGLTFATGLRSILRQDPDIIMIGEIRDSETAQIAMRAAITGHLVLSTIHTNDAASAIARLMDMGIETYIAASSLVGVVAQRLVRKICPRCRSEYQPDDYEKMMFNLSDGEFLYKGKGCPACNHTGYSGRIAVHEILIVNKEIKGLISENASAEVIKDRATQLGMIPLKDGGVYLAKAGVTTAAEVISMSYSV
ncbi:MAG: GspE/PulE family protein [Clostridiales bacterium]|jgi:type IV pilus assembly protein PilB|nr:GspE/PulE family protein [Clostridiales bacterium]